MLKREWEAIFSALFLALFFGCLATIVALLSLRFYSDSFPGYAVAFLGFAVDASLFCFAYLRYGAKGAASALLVFAIFTYMVLLSTIFSSVVLSLLLFSLSVAWCTEIKGYSFSAALESLGIRKGGLLKNAVLGVLAVVVIYAILFTEALILLTVGFRDTKLVVDVVSRLPVYIWVFSFTLVPIFEETFFRGFLMPRIGVVLSSLLFAAAHVAYGSLFELVAAFTIGIIFSLIYRRTRTLTTTMVAHAIFNLITVIVAYHFGGAV